MKQSALRLDDLYRMTAYIYADRNSVRSKERTFAHFVEVCGMLTVQARHKRDGRLGLTDALCKALGWYFPLLAKMKVESVEELVFRKFPNACPYCRLSPHREGVCKQVQGTERTVNHPAVVALYKDNWQERPAGLDEWQEMFSDIYPRNMHDDTRSLLGLFEEIGELGEAVRVYDAHPEYFFGEAADVFSYIMGLANEHSLREERDGREFSFEREFLMRYPGLCVQCGSRVCVCPAIPPATVGRLAKELKFEEGESPYIRDLKEFHGAGSASAPRAFQITGGYTSLVAGFPFDRGDANQALVQLCLKLAELLDERNSPLASWLRSEAIKLGDSVSPAGTPPPTFDVNHLLVRLRCEWQQLTQDEREKIGLGTELVLEIGRVFEI